MKILYLDQNKWIELARAQKAPDNYPEQYAVLATLVAEANAGRLVVPLTETNQYETQKIDLKERREHLAWVQATLSQGKVFRGRHKRLEVEIIDLLRARCNLDPISREPYWFLSDVFFESAAEIGDERIPQASERVLAAIRSNPPLALFEYLTGLPDDMRKTAVAKFSEDAEKLRQAIEAKRASDAPHSESLRRRLSSARLMINEIDLISSLVQKANLPAADMATFMQKHARSIINDAPTYFIEREIGLRIEQQDRPIEENDFRDMQTFCAVVAYADIVIAENMFSNLAIQAGLHKKYGTRIKTKLSELPAFLKAE